MALAIEFESTKVKDRTLFDCTMAVMGELKPVTDLTLRVIPYGEVVPGRKLGSSVKTNTTSRKNSAG
jgi:hypothetical protein